MFWYKSIDLRISFSVDFKVSGFSFKAVDLLVSGWVPGLPAALSFADWATFRFVWYCKVSKLLGHKILGFCMKSSIALLKLDFNSSLSYINCGSITSLAFWVDKVRTFLAFLWSRLVICRFRARIFFCQSLVVAQPISLYLLFWIWFKRHCRW